MYINSILLSPEHEKLADASLLIGISSFLLACFESKYPKYLHKSVFTRIFALDRSYFGKLCTH